MTIRHDPRIGINIDTTRRNCLLQTDRNFKGTRSRNRLLQMNQSLEEIKQGEYEHTGTTLVLFVYDVQAVNGFAAYPYMVWISSILIHYMIEHARKI